MTEAEREKAFYDRQYEPLLLAPEHAQRVDRQTMYGNCDDPRHPFFERRRLYAATLRALLEIPLAGLKVLDYGCGPADFGVWMATEGAEVTLLDISQTAVDLGILRATASGVGSQVRGNRRRRQPSATVGRRFLRPCFRLRLATSHAEVRRRGGRISEGRTSRRAARPM